MAAQFSFHSHKMLYLKDSDPSAFFSQALLLNLKKEWQILTVCFPIVREQYSVVEFFFIDLLFSCVSTKVACHVTS